MKIAIVGSAGKMGKELLKALREDKYPFILHACVTSPDSSSIDNKVIFGEIPSDSDIVIDFSTKEAVLENAKVCRRHKIAYVCGVTGLDLSVMEELHKYAQDNLVLYSSNMSLVVNILASLVEQAASLLDDKFDIEIVEMHHNQKVDSPSGTALILGKAAAKGRDVDFVKHAAFNRSGKRRQGDIGFAVIRGGDVVGEHKIIFAGKGERLELTHIDTDRAIFAHGALKAAQWLSQQKPGKLYSINDMLS